jgi:tRNA threonylcarbamoyladenosine biosynthesis protein TsaE
LQFIATSPNQLNKVANYILSNSEKKIILFTGDLGAGKTALIKHICKELDCIDDVSSPTFPLINHYKRKNGDDIFHFDFYRIHSTREAVDIGFEEYLESGSYCLIEWPEKIMQLLSEDFVEVEIKAEDHIRNIKVHR